MRYFLVSYAHPTGFGSIVINKKNDRMPNKDYINNKAALTSKVKPSDIIIMNIFEFKNEEDFINFNE